MIFAFLTLTLAANQVATGLALTIFGVGLSSMIGESFVGTTDPGLRLALPGRPRRQPGPAHRLRPQPAGLLLADHDRRRRLVPQALARRPDPARGRRERRTPRIRSAIRSSASATPPSPSAAPWRASPAATTRWCRRRCGRKNSPRAEAGSRSPSSSSPPGSRGGCCSAPTSSAAVMTFELQAKAAGINVVPPEFLAALPYLATIVVLALISMRRSVGAAAPGLPRPAVQAGRLNTTGRLRMTLLTRRSAARRPAAAAATLPLLGSRAFAADEPLKVGFVYLGPIGDFGWTYAHEQGRLAAGPGVRRQDQDHLRRERRRGPGQRAGDPATSPTTATS